MKVERVLINPWLREPDRITVECGPYKRYFKPDEKPEVGKWLKSLWEQEQEENFGLILHREARVYYDIDWDSDHVLFCKFIAREA